MEIFDGIAEEHVQQALAATTPVRARAGTTLIAEYDTADEMFLLESGRVNIHANGAMVATLEPGVVIGEVGLFTLTVRTASVVAAETCHLRKLDRDAFDGLRDAGNPVAFRIERRTLQQLQARLVDQISSLQAVATGTPSLMVPIDPEPTAGLLAPLSHLAIGALLSTAVAFTGEQRRSLRRLSVGASLRVFETREMVSDPDDNPDGLGVLLEGRLEALARAPGRSVTQGMVRVDEVREGQMFNLGPTIEGTSPPVRFVAREPCSVVRLDGELGRALFEADNPRGSVLRQAMIQSLFSRLQGATRSLRDAHQTAVDAATAKPAGPRSTQPRVREDAPALFDLWFDAAGSD